MKRWERISGCVGGKKDQFNLDAENGEDEVMVLVVGYEYVQILFDGSFYADTLH